MCGRFTLHTERDLLAEEFEIDLSGLDSLAPRYNIAPQQDVLTLCESDSKRAAQLMRWGLIPRWAKPLSKLPNMINARVETIAEKPAYREAFRKRRCAILADGFFEWQGSDKGKTKQPHWIHRRDCAPFAMAGIWESWTGGDTEQPPLITCSILTAPANQAVSAIHARMPVILDPAALSPWLSADNYGNTEGLHELLRPLAADQLASHAVSTLVNNPAQDTGQLIEKYIPEQASLF